MLPTIRRRELMGVQLRADTDACTACQPHPTMTGFVVLCQRHQTDDLFDRL